MSENMTTTTTVNHDNWVQRILLGTASPLLVALIIGGFALSRQVAVMQEQILSLQNSLHKVEQTLDKLVDRTAYYHGSEEKHIVDPLNAALTADGGH
jgi:type II secretory pathway component PulJ